MYDLPTASNADPSHSNQILIQIHVNIRHTLSMKNIFLSLLILALSACNVTVPTTINAGDQSRVAPIVDDTPQTITPICLQHNFHCSEFVIQATDGPLVIACNENPASAIVDQTVTQILDLPEIQVDAGWGLNVKKSFTTDLLVAYDSVNGSYAMGPDVSCPGECHMGTKFYVVVHSIDEGMDLLGANDSACQ